MSQTQDSIIKYSNEILDYLLTFKELHPDFTFSLRKRDSVQSKDKRLEEGQWFQGSHYLLVPLFKKGDNARKIKTIGFQITFDHNGNIQNTFIEISFKKGVDDLKEIQFHRELSDYIGLDLNEKNHGIKEYSEKEDIWNNLKSYITDFRTHALKLLEKFDLKEKYLISEIDFQKDLNKIIAIKKKLQHPIIPSNPVSIIEDHEPKNAYVMLNQILYGPPGTGKTYNSISKALEIINEEEEKELNWEDRTAVKNLFNKRVTEDRIVFTTFHQSMSYEDFIEGIKPVMKGDEEGGLDYEIQDGILKVLCNKATSENYSNIADNFDVTWDKLIELVKTNISNNNLLKIGSWEYGLSTKNSLKYSSLNSPSQYTFTITKQNIYDAYQNKKARPSGAFQKDMEDIVKFMKNKLQLNEYIEDKNLPNKDKQTNKNYVLIIDEINRGNVSQIFGELITLIEEDKRLGKEEALQVTLPYSKEKFGVPANLYIIGTMNTADRSVEALDAALRRRFCFEEMPPLYNLDGLQYDISENKAFEILKTINSRIEKLIDKDHAIGHSYLLNKDKNSIVDSFYKNIIPLLQEYFFGDYGKLGLVIGKGFVHLKESDKGSDTFADFDDASNDFESRNVYEIIDYRKVKDHKIGSIEMTFEKAIQVLMNKKVD